MTGTESAVCTQMEYHIGQTVCQYDTCSNRDNEDGKRKKPSTKATRLRELYASSTTADNGH